MNYKIDLSDQVSEKCRKFIYLYFRVQHEKALTDMCICLISEIITDILNRNGDHKSYKNFPCKDDFVSLLQDDIYKDELKDFCNKISNLHNTIKIINDLRIIYKNNNI